MVKEETSKSLWEKIDWKGNMSKDSRVRPTNDELALRFEKLYTCNDPEESQKIDALETDLYNPLLDDPITSIEIKDAMKEMKKRRL